MIFTHNPKQETPPQDDRYFYIASIFGCISALNLILALTLIGVYGIIISALCAIVCLWAINKHKLKDNGMLVKMIRYTIFAIFVINLLILTIGIIYGAMA